jgi:cytochrome b561
LYYKVAMKAIKRTLAATELLLVFPAGLFMTALFVRNIQPAPYEPAQTARRVVEWFSTKPHLGLQLFLIAMPLAAFVIGCATVLRSWRSDEELRQAALKTLAAARAHLATLLIAGATLVAGCVLAIVALHVITD